MPVEQDLAFTPALELAALVRSGDLSSRELVDLYLERIDRHNPVLNCYLTVAHESARAQADAADAAPVARRR